jgi:RHS repeat-associated core domain
MDKKVEGFTYTGEQQERNGLIYLRARYYKPEYESFISKDTYKGKKESILSQNRYTYVENNPIKYVDSSGNFAIETYLVYTGIVALAALATPQGQSAIRSGVSAIGYATIEIAGDIRNGFNTLGSLATSKARTSVALPRYTICPTPAIPIVKSLGIIASGYAYGKCQEAAAMVRELKNRNKKGSIITLTWIGGWDKGHVWSDIAGRYVGSLPIHVGVQYNGIAYCNIHIYGLSKQSWINDFHFAGGFKQVHEVKF